MSGIFSEIYDAVNNAIPKTIFTATNQTMVSTAPSTPSAVEIIDLGSPADNSFAVGAGGVLSMKTLAETKVILGIYPLYLFSATSSLAVTSTSETTLIPTGIGSTTVDVSLVPPIVGSRLIIAMNGFISTAASAGTSTMAFKVGGVTVLTSVVTLPNSLTDCPFEINFELTFRAVGASATVIGNGMTHIYNGTNGIFARPLLMKVVSGTFNSNANIVVDVTNIFGSSGNTMTVTNALIKLER